jgi:hypothetical protein
MSACAQVKPVIVGIDNPMILVLAVLSGIGMSCVLATFGVFLRYSSTPIVKAAGAATVE